MTSQLPLGMYVTAGRVGITKFDGFFSLNIFADYPRPQWNGPQEALAYKIQYQRQKWNKNQKYIQQDVNDVARG